MYRDICAVLSVSQQLIYIEVILYKFNVQRICI